MTTLEFYGVLLSGMLIGFGIGIWFALRYRKNG